MKIFKFLFTILFTLTVSSQTILASENGSASSLGRKGLTKERIEQFEKIIKSNKGESVPDLKVVKRTKPYITKFPIETKSASVQVQQGGEISSHLSDEQEYEHEHEQEQEQEQGLTDSTYSGDYIEPISSDIETSSDDVINMQDINNSKVFEDEEVSTDITQDIQVSLDKEAELSNLSQKKQHDPISKDNLELTSKQRKKLEKERLKQEKKDKKLKKKMEKERLKRDKLEKKKLEKEKKEQLKNNKGKSPSFSTPNISDEDEKDSSCSSKNGKKQKNKSAPLIDDSLEEKLNSQEVASEVSDHHSIEEEDLSTVVSENEVFENLSSVDEGENVENDDILVEKPKDDVIESDDEIEDSEIKARMLAGNENDFKTERISSEELLQDSDSDYLEGEEYQNKSEGNYKFSEESEDLISKERAVEPLEGVEVEGFSEVEDDDASNTNDVPATSNYSGEQEDDDSNLSNAELNSGIELSKDNLSEDQGQVTNSVDVEEIDMEEPEKVDEDFSSKDLRSEETVPGHKNKVKTFFGKIKSFFKRKPSSVGCKGPSCIRRLSKKDEPKYSNDFIPRIYLLSRSIPQENFYRIPEIISSLRSESNRLVFAYQLIDGSLIPSSALALNSKSFIVRRWGKNVQTKLTKLRSEFDTLKNRLSSMYHEGVLKGEFELFIEEMDDLTIMLYLLAKEFPSKHRFANTARDILRYPEVVSTPGQRLISIFRKSKIASCSKKSGEPAAERDENDKLAIKALKKRMKFIKKRLNSLGN